MKTTLLAIVAGFTTGTIMQNTTRTLPYVGGRLMCYSTAWTGPRPATVANHLLPGVTSAEVVVFCDPPHDRMQAAQPISMVEVFDAMSQDVRTVTLAGQPIRQINGVPMQVLCEWAK